MFKFGPIRGLDSVQQFIKALPYRTKREAIIGVAEYLVGDSRHGFRHDDPYRRTTRRAVYGQQWESDAQRRYVMAAIKSGEIVLGQRRPNPTDASKGYGYKLTNSGYGANITNEKPGAYWTRVWGGWRNWRNTMQVIRDNIRGALRHALARVNAVLRRKGR